MPVVCRAPAGRVLRVALRIAGRVLRVVAFLLLFAVALFVPVPVFGRTRYEPPPRRNAPAEVEKRR